MFYHWKADDAMVYRSIHYRLTFLALDDNEHGFSLRTTAIQAGGVIQAMVAKTVLEVAPASAPVRIPVCS